MLIYGGHEAAVFALAFGPDGVTLASGDKAGTVLLRDADGTPVSVCEAGPKTPAVHGLAVLAGGAVVVAHAHGWCIFDRTADAIRVRTLGDSSATGVAPLGPQLLAVGTGVRGFRSSGALDLWDVATGRRRGPGVLEPNGVRAVAAAPDAGVVAWATGHCKVKAWDVRQQTPVEFPQKKDVYAVALSADGLTLAAAVDYTAAVYDTEKKRERAVLRGHKGRVEAVAVSPDGATVATGSWDQTVRLWDAATGRERACYTWPIGKVFSLAYAPDGLRLAAGGETGQLVVWDVE